MFSAASKLNLELAWWIKFFKIRESTRVLPYLNPAQAWMCPLQRTDDDLGIQFWPPPRRGPGKADADDGGDGDDGADDHPDSGNEDEDQVDDDIVAQRREVNALLEDGLRAMQAGMAADKKDKAKAKETEPEPSDSGGEYAPSLSSDSSSSEGSEAAEAAPAAPDGSEHALRGSTDVAVRVPGPGVRFAKAKGSQGQGTRPPKGSPLSRNKAKVPKAL